MIRPSLTADGTAVRLPLALRVAPLLDELATAYAEDPGAVGRLLAEHAAAVARLDHVVCDPDASDVQRAVRAAAADSTRDALTAELPSAEQLDERLNPREAMRLADSIAARASRAALTRAHIKNSRSNAA